LSLLEILLENYHILQDCENLDLKPYYLDLEKALKEVSFTPDEQLVLQHVYFTIPDLPERDREDKNGSSRGRPLGGTVQKQVGDLLVNGKSRAWAYMAVAKVKKNIIQKISDYLGPGYEVGDLSRDM